jgi:hypothetical protein
VHVRTLVLTIYVLFDFKRKLLTPSNYEDMLNMLLQNFVMHGVVKVMKLRKSHSVVKFSNV